jgi:hypothetical protein
MSENVGLSVLALLGVISGVMASSVGTAVVYGLLIALAYTTGCWVGNDENND